MSRPYKENRKSMLDFIMYKGETTVEENTRKKNHLKHIKARELKENKNIQKRYKAQRAGAPDNKVIKQNKAPLYIHDAVKRENDKKIQPSHLKSTTNPNKVIKSLQGKIDAMREIQKDDTLPMYKKGI
jgi:hypothetical protein